MPSEHTPPPSEPDAPAGKEQAEAEAEADFAQACSGESGDPIWESRGPQVAAGGNAARAERARRALREPEGTVPAGRLIDLVQGQAPSQRPPARRVGA